MANPLDDIVDINVSFTGASIPTAKGFGTPLILALKDGSFSGSTLEINSASTLLTNGYLSTDAEYIMASKIFSQNPKPEKAVIGKTSGYDPKFKVELTPLSSQVFVGKDYSFSMDIGDGNNVAISSKKIPDNTYLKSVGLTAAPTIDTLTLDISVNGAGAVTATFTDDTISDAQTQLNGLTGVTAAIVETDKILLTATTAGETLEVTGGTALSVFKFPAVVTEVSAAAQAAQAVEIIQSAIEGSLISRHLSATPTISGLTLEISVNGETSLIATFTANTIADAQSKLNALVGVTATIVDTDQIKIESTDALKTIEVKGGTALDIFNYPLGSVKPNSTLKSHLTMTDASSNLQIEVTSQGGLFGFVKSNLDFDILETTAVPTGTFLSDALTSIRNENDDWYAVMLPYGGKQLASQPLLHDLLKDNERIMFFNSLDDEVLKDTTGNIAETLYDANKDRIVAFFHHNVVDMPHCAWAGRVLPENPGSVTWMFKSLSGVTAESFTTAEQGKLDSNNVNRYVKISGLSITRNGTSSRSGFYVDVARGRDFIKARMQEAIFRQLATLKKIPFTDQGIAVVENEIRAILRLSISQGILSSDPQPVVLVPKASDVQPSDKANRTLPDVSFSATLAGAVHKVQISGTVSV